MIPFSSSTGPGPWFALGDRECLFLEYFKRLLQGPKGTLAIFGNLFDIQRALCRFVEELEGLERMLLLALKMRCVGEAFAASVRYDVYCPHILRVKLDNMQGDWKISGIDKLLLCRSRSEVGSAVYL
jgi:hypothetical protein